MTHLKIELNNGIIEEVSSAVIDKLYDIVHNGNLDNTSNLIGRLHTNATYLLYIDYLEDVFKIDNVKLLIIDADKKYIWFTDPEVARVIATLYGDGTGIVMSDMVGITSLIYDLFNSNTTIILFNELGYFSSVKELESNCFKRASNLLSIDLSNITTLNVSTFSECSKLENVIFKDSAYNYNSSTGYIEISAPFVSIGSTVFYSCSKIFKTTTFGQTTAKIHLILNNCTNIGRGAFLNSGISAISIPNVAITSPDIFNGCTNLEYADISYGTSIPSKTFFQCTSLSTVVFSNLLTEIGAAAFLFSGISGPFTIPATVTSIGGAAFANTNISCFIFLGNTPPSTLGSYGWPNVPVYVPDAAVSDYQAAFAAATSDAIKNNILPISNYNPT